jgi:arsenate reductase (thioredoxin)
LTTPIYNVLFLCTGNSARSILAEAILNQTGRGTFKAFSAGSHPKGEVNPLALDQLRKSKLPISGYRSKSWNEFIVPGAPTLDFVITVCDKAAGESCPTWPGQPLVAHWGIPDPAEVEGNEEVKEDAFLHSFLQLQTRINLFVALKVDSLNRFSLDQKLRAIGKTTD